MLVFDTIVALSTPPYKSALAIIRLSGPKALSCLSPMMKRKADTLIANTSYFTKLYNKDGSLIDETVITYFKGPKSYTGFDSIDISIHGSMIIAEEVINELVKNGARRAQRGEFSAQAYFNGKMDLLKAEGVNDLINASSKRAKELACKTLNGNNSTKLKELKNTILDYLSRMEYHVENQYDDDNEFESELDEISLLLNKDISSLNSTIEKTKKANREYNGFKICIAGEPNVGKSTLLNALLKEDKAIVSPIPGTTRDVVEGEKEIRGITFKFLDTAGIRESEDVIENLGIKKSYQMIEKSDIVILASDKGFKEIDENVQLNQLLKDKAVIRLATKGDLNSSKDGADLSICSLNDDLSPLIDLIFEKLNINNKEESEFLGKREEDFLIKIKEQLEMANNAIAMTHQIDIVSDTLRVAISLINEMMGNSQGQTMEDIYNTLFSKFCLGK